MTINREGNITVEETTKIIRDTKGEESVKSKEGRLRVCKEEKGLKDDRARGRLIRKTREKKRLE